MKNKDKIILYLDGQMTALDKAAFEQELSSSESLRNELKLYADFNSGIKSLNEINGGEDYFVNMVPRFRNRLERKKTFRLSPVLAYSASTAAAVFILMFFVFNRNTKTVFVPVQNTTAQSVNSESVQDVSGLSDQFDFVNINKDDAAAYDTLLNSMLVKELDLTPQSLSEINAADNNSMDIQSIMQGVNQKEADAIYKEILHKKIL